jgi:sec-independent protein translocase protein TatB
MFDIGFMELLLISIVALLVLGPEKLPHAIRTTALWVGRARRSFTKVKSEIEQQLNADEIRRQLHNESILKDLDEAKKKANKLAKDTSESLSSLGDEISGKKSPLTRKGNEPEKLPNDDTDDSPDPAAEKEITGSDENPTGSDESPDKEDSKKPVTDFYNNPDAKVVTLKDGGFSAPEKPDAESDTGKKGDD